MAVYVDPLFHWKSTHPPAFFVGKRNNHQWCHMTADSDAELHALAQSIGLKRGWHQPSPPASVSHYDLTPGMRAKAIGAGAIEVARGFRPKVSRSAAELHAIGQRMRDQGRSVDSDWFAAFCDRQHWTPEEVAHVVAGFQDEPPPPLFPELDQSAL